MRARGQVGAPDLGVGDQFHETVFGCEVVDGLEKPVQRGVAEATQARPRTRSISGSRAIAAGLGILATLTAALGLMMVIVAGFALSFDAIRAVGQASRIRHDWAWLLPAAVDGAMSVATVSLVVLRRLNRSTAYPWFVVGVNAAISVTCNGLHAHMGPAVTLPTAAMVAVSAVPTLNLALSVHLLVVLVEALATALAHLRGPSRRFTMPKIRVCTVHRYLGSSRGEISGNVPGNGRWSTHVPTARFPAATN